MWDTAGTPTVLPPLTGWENTNASLISDAGSVIEVAEGSISFPRDEVAALLLAGSSTPTILNDAGGQGVVGVIALNANNDSAGYSTGVQGSEAVYWNEDGVSTVLKSVGGKTGTDYVTTINDNGLIGGVSHNVGVVWSSNGRIVWHSHSRTYRAYPVNADTR